jgi:hypothetical protein
MPLRPGLVLALLAPPALADTPCALPAHSGWGSDPPAIHAAPAPDSAVLGHAPQGAPGTDEAGRGAVFTVTEVRNGWARVAGVTGPTGEGAAPDGWISAEAVAFMAQTQVAFAGPDAEAAVVWTGMDWPGTGALLGCKGDWAHLRFPLPERRGAEYVEVGQVTGWVRGLCNNQWTTCDGVQGDWATDHGVTLE